MSEIKIAKIVVGGAMLMAGSMYGLSYIDEQRNLTRQLERDFRQLGLRYNHLLVERAELSQELKSHVGKLPKRYD